MTYELHGEFIVPASKYVTVVQIEIFSCGTALALVVCYKCNFRKILKPSKITGIRSNKSLKNTSVLNSVRFQYVSRMVLLSTDKLVMDLV